MAKRKSSVKTKRKNSPRKSASGTRKVGSKNPDKNNAATGKTSKDTRARGKSKRNTPAKQKRSSEIDILNDLLLNQLRAKKKRRKKTKERLIAEGWEDFEIDDDILDSEDDY